MLCYTGFRVLTEITRYRYSMVLETRDQRLLKEKSVCSKRSNNIAQVIKSSSHVQCLVSFPDECPNLTAITCAVCCCHSPSHSRSHLRDHPSSPSAKLPNSFLAAPFPARNASSLSANTSSPGSGFLRPYLSKRSGSSTVSSDAGLVVAFRSTLGCGCEELGPEVDDDGSYERVCR
jgi:hypothetical protein